MEKIFLGIALKFFEVTDGKVTRVEAKMGEDEVL